jgi:flagellar protein FliO/FliZ
VTGLGFQSLFAVVVVLGLVAGFAWLLRRGAFGALRPGSRSVTVETAVPLGERRSLVIVAVEGRRLLLGLTPGQISMVTELGAAAPAPIEPGSDASGGTQSFEQLLLARAKDMFTRRGPSGDATNPRLRVTGLAAWFRRRTADAQEPDVRFGDILQLSAQQQS